MNMASRAILLFSCMMCAHALLHRAAEAESTKEAKPKMLNKPVKMLNAKLAKAESKKEEAEPAKKDAAKSAKKEEAEPAKKEAAKPAKNEEATEASKPVVDNFKEELVDQADPEFDKMSGGDNCISQADGRKVIKKQFQLGAPDLSSLTEGQKEQRRDAMESMLEDAKIVFRHADKNGDGCLDRAEFKAAGELEEVPPGFEKVMEEFVGKKAYAKRMARQMKFDFDALDRNGDQKLSQSEAYHFVAQNMPQADLSTEKLKKMFADADANKDKFLSFEEFLVAGKVIKGDGKKENADVEPMTEFAPVP